MKQQKAMLIALIVICLTVIVTAKTSARYESEPARRRSLSSQLTNLRSKRPGGGEIPRHL